METLSREKNIYRFFRIGVLLKGANAILEIFGGLAALAIPPAFVTTVALYLASGELGEDPRDFFATHMLSWAKQFSVGGELFAALYLLSHGIVKLLLVVGLLANKLWAYPASLAVFGLFVVYQGYLFYLNSSAAIIALTVFDLIVMWLIWREYAVVLENSHKR